VRRRGQKFVLGAAGNFSRLARALGGGQQERALVLGALGFVDVGIGAEPAHDLSARVA
jgi:hypothetical protein